MQDVVELGGGGGGREGCLGGGGQGFSMMTFFPGPWSGASGWRCRGWMGWRWGWRW